MEKISESFRMGIREARKAMSGGGLLALINLDRLQQVGVAMSSGDQNAIAGVLHEMGGPFNARMLSSDIDTDIVANAERMSSRLAITLIADVLGRQADREALVFVKALSDAMCEWIDTGEPFEGAEPDRAQSAMAARLISETFGFEVQSAESARVRLHALLRFSPAIGVIETVLRMPADLPVRAH